MKADVICNNNINININQKLDKEQIQQLMNMDKRNLGPQARLPNNYFAHAVSSFRGQGFHVKVNSANHNFMGKRS
jgi:hypothetical protein